MKQTRQADHTVRVTLDLRDSRRAGASERHRSPGGGLISRPFLTETARIVVDRGFVETQRGDGGGIALVRQRVSTGRSATRSEQSGCGF